VNTNIIKLQLHHNNLVGKADTQALGKVPDVNFYSQLCSDDGFLQRNFKLLELSVDSGTIPVGGLRNKQLTILDLNNRNYSPFDGAIIAFLLQVSSSMMSCWYNSNTYVLVCRPTGPSPS
jgi:hypothetical protein